MSLGCHLPFELRGQACTRPARERVGLKVTDVANRHSGATGCSPASVNWCHVPSRRVQYNGRFPPPLAYRLPAHRQPQLRALISTVGHELQIVATGHQPVASEQTIPETGDDAAFRCRNRNHSPSWPTPYNPSSKSIQSRWPAAYLLGRRRALAIHRKQRIVREHVFDIREHQFLMLLFVLQAQLE